MTKQSHHTDHEEEFPYVFKAVCVEAMQIALEVDGAPARCPARNCRKTGRCHVKAEGDRPVCQAGIPGPVALTAALMVMFAAPPDTIGARSRRAQCRIGV